MRFLIFADILSSKPNKAKNSLPKFQFFDLIWHVYQNEKTQHLRGRFKSKKQFKFSF